MFIVGLIIGGWVRATLGIVLMCLLQIIDILPCL